MPPGAPLLQRYLRFHDGNGTPREVRFTRYRADRIAFSMVHRHTEDDAEPLRPTIVPDGRPPFATRADSAGGT